VGSGREAGAQLAVRRRLILHPAELLRRFALIQLAFPSMLKPRTLTILAAMLIIYGVLVLPSFIWPSYAASPADAFVLVPAFSTYAFHQLGVPGLLPHDGLCGWGWCAPTPFGWTVLVLFWLAAAGLRHARCMARAVPAEPPSNASTRARPLEC
jgi:hypothetical protein